MRTCKEMLVETQIERDVRLEYFLSWLLLGYEERTFVLCVKVQYSDVKSYPIQKLSHMHYS